MGVRHFVKPILFSIGWLPSARCSARRWRTLCLVFCEISSSWQYGDNASCGRDVREVTTRRRRAHTSVSYRSCWRLRRLALREPELEERLRGKYRFALQLVQ